MPVIDHTFMALPFIPGDPYDLVTSGQYADVDVMIGGTKDEGIIYLLGAEVEIWMVNNISTLQMFWVEIARNGKSTGMISTQPAPRHCS